MEFLNDLWQGGIGGFIGAIFTLAGFNWRLKKLEEKTQTKEICEERHKSLNIILERLENKQDYILKRFDDFIMEWKKNNE